MSESLGEMGVGIIPPFSLRNFLLPQFGIEFFK